MSERYVIAVDLGAESGRVMRAGFDGLRIEMTEVHRFPNKPVYVRDTLYWNILDLWQNIKDGIEKAADGYEIASIGLDTWGVDVGMLDSTGKMLSIPVHYRDERTEGAMDWVFERVPRREVYERTGIQFIQLNGLYQVASLSRDGSSLFDAAHTIFTIADLFNYMLTGTAAAEFTMASTWQAVDPRTRDWDRELLAKVGVPVERMAPIVQPGTRLGEYEGIPVIASVCHDTGAAVVGVPATNKNYAYLSSGTWSLLGLELDHAVINDAAYEANLTNEGGYGGTFRFLRNIMGMWLVQQCRAIWAEEGREYSYDDLVRISEEAEPFQAVIDPDDDSFFRSENMPQQIRDYLARTGQTAPDTDGGLVRAIYESLALKYSLVMKHLVDVSGQPVEQLHIIGGGSRNKLVCQMAANATGVPVVAGPAEATALGNAVVQFITYGDLANLDEARQMLAKSIDTTTYQPQNVAAWNEQAQRLAKIIG